jgi:ribosomal protein L37AE/L43A
MGVEEKNGNETLSRIAADLFVNPKGGEELSSKIHRLRDEIKKVIESGDTIFGKFRELVESFREIIPEEKQRYNAAIKALSTTSKLSRQEIVKAVNNQLEELKILEKGLMPALPGGRDELKAMEAKSREMRDEISKLREKIAQLESEEKEILNGMEARKKETELVGKAVAELFTDIGAEIAYIKKKVEEFTAESTASRPIPPVASIKNDAPGEVKGGDDQKSDILESSAPQDTEFQKKCPMCGGRMNFQINEGMWMCYSCAYEESKEEKGGGGQKSEILESSASQDTEFQKKCPMCGGQMNFHSSEEMWVCYSCAYEELKKDEVRGKSEKKSEHTDAPEPASAAEPIFDFSPPPAFPLESLSSDEYEESKEEPSPPNSKQPSSKKKACPVCRKKMNWYETEKAWRCPFCEYERRI